MVTLTDEQFRQLSEALTAAQAPQVPAGAPAAPVSPAAAALAAKAPHTMNPDEFRTVMAARLTAGAETAGLRSPFWTGLRAGG